MSSLISELNNASNLVTIYIGIPILIIGVIGGILNLIVFLSLKTFRENSCAFYLMIMSWVNIGQLLTGNLSRIISTGYNIDWTGMSLSYCKFRWFAIQTCTLTSYACLCFATIDQYLATSSRHRWQQWSNIKLAHHLCASAFLLSLLHGIPCLIYYNHFLLPATGVVICHITNNIYLTYNVYIYLLFLSGILPIFVTVLFGTLAYRNVRQIPYRTVPLVRRELDKQLTSMTLIQCCYSSLVILIYITWTIMNINLNLNNQTLIGAQMQVVTYLIGILYYLYFASPFYVYVCVSERFRQQLFYVLFRIHFNRFRRQVAPQIQT